VNDWILGILLINENENFSILLLKLGVLFCRHFVDCVCTHKIRSGCILNTVQCWWQHDVPTQGPRSFLSACSKPAALVSKGSA